jgi:phospholipid-binding lipoprotein MlaA
VRSAPHRGVRRQPAWALAPLLILVLLGGCASTAYRTAGDPLEPFNRKMFVFNDRLDHWILQPVSQAYVKVAPDGLQRGGARAYGIGLQ